MFKDRLRGYHQSLQSICSQIFCRRYANGTFFIVLLAGFLATSRSFSASIHPEPTRIYYVATNGNDRNPGTQTMPFRTIQKGADVVEPGEAVYVRGGTYSEQVTVKTSGNPEQIIVFKPEPGTSQVILKNPAKVDGPSAVFFVQDKSYNRIEGFTFKDFQNGFGVYLVSTDIDNTTPPHLVRGNEIVNNRFINIGNVKVASPSWVRSAVRLSYAGPNNIIEGNYFAGNYGESIKLWYSFENLVHNNTITAQRSRLTDWAKDNRQVAVGIRFGGENKEVSNPERTKGRNNIISNNRIFAVKQDSPKYEFNAIWCDVNGDNNQILRNWVYNTAGKGIFIESRCDNNVIRENIVYNNDMGGFVTASYGVGPASRTQWINNVAFNNGRAGFALINTRGNTVKNNIGFNNRGAEIFVSKVTVSAGGNTFKNNLWFDSGDRNIGLWNTSKGYQASPELTFSQWVSTSNETGAVSGNPQFSDTHANDFHVHASSLAVHAGEGGVDIGAYPGGKSSSLAAPTNLRLIQ